MREGVKMLSFFKQFSTYFISMFIILAFTVVGLFYTATDVNAAVHCSGHKTCLMTGQSAID